MENKNYYNVLYLEDEYFFFKVIKTFAIERQSLFHIKNAPDVITAKEMFDSEYFDAVICDYYLPESNGIEFLKYIRSKCNVTPVIFLTGVDSKDVAVEALNNGADYYLEKNSLVSEENKYFDNLFYQLEKIIKRKKAESLIHSETDIKEKFKMAFDITDHDIRNCITIISLSVDAIKAICEEDKAGIYRATHNIEESIHDIMHCLSFLRDYKELENNDFTWQSINSIIEKLIHQFNSRILIENTIKEDIHIYSNKFLEKVFYNLIDNSIKHGEASKCTISTTMSNDELVIMLEDNGPGITQECKNVIFSRGYGKNTGYGLFFCSEVLSMTGISIVEEGTNGACFNILIPKKSYKISCV